MAAPARDVAKAGGAVSSGAQSAAKAKGNFLAKVTVYSDLAEEMSRLADQRSQSAQVKSLAKTIAADHHDANGRLTSYVLSKKVNLPVASLQGDEKTRATAAMVSVQKLETLNGAAFDRAFVDAAQKLPELATQELMTGRQSFADDAELLAVVDPLLQAMDAHRKTAEGLSQTMTGAAAARRPPSQNR
ncbi:MAG: DUF4142 domain-containing protein [Myxococcaceae bacterium]